jgi:GDP-L-fucose synthase
MTSSIAIEDDANWRVFVASNLYGPNDHFNTEKSHLLAAIISKAVSAKENNLKSIEMWGDGTPKREFLLVDDLAKICLDLLKLENPPNWINVGTDQEMSILELAQKIAKVVGFEGNITTGDPSMDGTPRKKLDCTLLKSVIQFKETPFEQGLTISYQDFLQNKNGRHNI